MISESLAELAKSDRSAGPTEAKLLRGRQVIGELADAWATALVEGPSTSPFAHPDWTRVWLESFAPNAEPLLVHARTGGRDAGFAPLIERDTQLIGLRFRVWQTPANEHSQRTDWCAGEDAIRAIWRRLRESEGWELLQLPNLVQGGLVDRTLGRAAEEDGYFIHRQPSLQSPWLPVPRPEALDAALDAKFRANLRRRRRKLAAQGPLTLVRAERGPEAIEVLREGLELEAQGWKGEQGTAIASKANTMQFYTALARAFEERGWLSLYLLRLGSRAIAFHYALTYGGRYHLLKPAYDEALSACSPGQLMVDEVLRDLHRRGVEVFDFLGPTMAWKRDWTDRHCSHCGTWVIRPSWKGRILASHFRAMARAKRWAKRLLRGAR